MRQVILTMLMAVVSSSAFAEWVAIGSTDKFSAYVDAATIRQAGNMVKMWNLIDYKKAARTVLSGKPYLSATSQNEYDCKEERSRMLYSYWYTGNMREGKEVDSSSEPSEWEPVPPESVAEAEWKFACRKR
jgi:hypothetical protein